MESSFGFKERRGGRGKRAAALGRRGGGRRRGRCCRRRQVMYGHRLCCCMDVLRQTDARELALCDRDGGCCVASGPALSRQDGAAWRLWAGGQPGGCAGRACWRGASGGSDRALGRVRSGSGGIILRRPRAAILACLGRIALCGVSSFARCYLSRKTGLALIAQGPPTAARRQGQGTQERARAAAAAQSAASSTTTTSSRCCVRNAALPTAARAIFSRAGTRAHQHLMAPPRGSL